jgi:hypothetical protein
MSGQAKVLLDDVVIGDKKDIVLNISATGVDFTSGLSVAAKLRADNGTAVVFTFAPVTAVPGAGQLTVTLSLASADTTALGLGSFVGDCVISATGFGPYTPIQFTFNVTPKITQ